MISQEKQDNSGTQRVPLKDLKTQEIALKIKINGQFIKAILDTGSPVTVISRRVYDAMNREFKGEGSKVVQSVTLNEKFFRAKGTRQ